MNQFPSDPATNVSPFSPDFSAIQTFYLLTLNSYTKNQNHI